MQQLRDAFKGNQLGSDNSKHSLPASGKAIIQQIVIVNIEKAAMFYNTAF